MFERGVIQLYGKYGGPVGPVAALTFYCFIIRDVSHNIYINEDRPNISNNFYSALQLTVRQFTAMKCPQKSTDPS